MYICCDLIYFKEFYLNALQAAGIREKPEGSQLVIHPKYYGYLAKHSQLNYFDDIY